jgi:GWxTD domain-containing protein
VGAQAPGDATLELGSARFYRAASGQTVVDVFCRVPFTLLDPVTRGPGGVAAFRVAVAVRDSAGLTLLEQAWTQTVPARVLTMARGSTVEHFTFAARPGRYTVDVAITDSASGRVTRQSQDVSGYAESPGASDLLLASDLRQAAGPADTTPRAGEIRKGSLFLGASSRPVLTPQQAQLGYYAEIYLAAPETVAVAMRVTRADGGQVIAVAPQQLALGVGGGATRGLVPLAGLPAGEYRLEVTVRGRAGEQVRAAPFGMAGFETEAALAAAAPVPRDVFDGMSEPQLDTLYGPLVYLMNESEQGMYPTLSSEGKRNYLRQFWSRRDPTAGTQRNEAQEDYYRRIADANQRFREGGTAQIPGWRTDRGRIFLKYGAPDEVLSRPQAGSANPYEVWKYTRGRALKYVFLDQTRFGNYALIWTDDRREPSRPNWQELLGPDAVLDVERF